MRDRYLKRLVASDQRIDELDERTRSLTTRQRSLDTQLGNALRDFEG